MSKCLNIYDIQKMRYDSGAIVYNTNNYQYAIVIDGNKGDDSDPCSFVFELNGKNGFMLHTPPNRALIPTGRHIDMNDLISHMRGQRKEGADHA